MKKISIQVIADIVLGQNTTVSNHPLAYASCFVGHSRGSQGCKIINSTIDGIAKLLAYGDYLKARTSQRNETIFSILDEELSQYPYLRKSPARVSNSSFCAHFVQ